MANSAPTEIRLSATSFAETAKGVLASLSWSDPDKDSLSFTVSDSRFAIVNGKLTLKSGQVLDYETEPSIALSITGTDPGKLSVTRDFVLTIENRNERPSAVTLTPVDGGTALHVLENAAGAAIARVAATDPDAGDRLSFSVSDKRFEVVDGLLQLKQGVSLNAESGSILKLVVSAKDQAGLSLAKTINLKVDDLPEAPSDIRLSASKVAENAKGAVIGSLGWSDPDRGDKPSYSVSDDRFEVVNGKLKLKAGLSLDHEAADKIALEITATDKTGLSFRKSFSITVRDVNEAPSGLSLSAGPVREGEKGAVIGRLSVTDPDEGDTITYRLTDTRFEVKEGLLKLKAGAALDFEKEASVKLTVVATDKGKASTRQDFVIAVQDVAEAPTDIRLSGTKLFENAPGATLGSLAWTDPDKGDAPAWLLSDDRFEVVGKTLKLKPGISLDFEAGKSLPLTITVLDRDGLSHSETFTIAVQNKNEAPRDLLLEARQIDPGVKGAVVAKLSASDPDAGDTLTFKSLDNRFEVVDGTLKLKDSVAIAGGAQTVSVDVRVTDKAGAATTETFLIPVGAVNVAPERVTLSQDHVAENAKGAVIGRLSVIDANAGDSHVLAVSDSRFEIVGGELKLKAGVALDHEAGGRVELTVSATDAAGARLDQLLTIHVDDVNEAPRLMALPDVSIAQGAQLSFKLPAGFATDPEGRSLTITATRPDGGAVPDWLSFNPKTGLFTGTPGAEDVGSMTLRITVSDGALSSSDDFVLTIAASAAPLTLVNRQPDMMSLSWYGSERPVLSGDGKSLLFASQSGHVQDFPFRYFTSFDLFSKDLVTGALKAVTQAYAPIAADLSADGAQIGFTWAGDRIGNVSLQQPDGEPRILKINGGSNWGSVWEGGSSTTRLDGGFDLSADGHYAGYGFFQEDITYKAGGHFAADWSWVTEFTTTRTTFSGLVRETLATGETVVVDVSAAGVQANGASSGLVLSGDGRYGVFASLAGNLTAADTNGAVQDIFRKDLVTGAVALVSSASDGTAGNAASSGAQVTADGRYVVFTSLAGNLAAGDSNGLADIFRKDLLTGELLRVSTAMGGAQADGGSWGADVSADGRYVSFLSDAGNLVSGDTNGVTDVFRKDLLTGEVIRVNVDAAGRQSWGAVGFASMSDDGQRIAFDSAADDLVAGDDNHLVDVFVADLAASGVTLTGTAGQDILIGSITGDRLIGGAGNDLLTGHGNQDVFVFAAGHGRDMITDFATGIDRIDLSAFGTRFGSFAKVMAATQQVGDTVVIATGATTAIVLNGVQRASLGADDFGLASYVAPTDITLSGGSLSENAAGAVVGRLGVVDADRNDKHSLLVTDDRFEVVTLDGAMVLKLKAGVTLDREATPTVTLSVVATDKGDLEFSKSFVLQVTDVNEAPVIHAPLSDIYVVAGSGFSVTLPEFYATDPEHAALSYSLLLNGQAAPAWLRFDPATGTLSGTGQTGASEDVITLIASDGSLQAEDQLRLVTTPANAAQQSGSSGKDVIIADANGSDIVHGGAGDDVLIGNSGQKTTYVFEGGHGQDEIFGFHSGDKLQLTEMDVPLRSLRDFFKIARQVGDDIFITTGNGDEIVLHDYFLGNIKVSDLIFAS